MTARTKIIATLGPASSNETVLRKMFINGLDIVRLNFSHGSWAEHRERVSLVRRLNGKLRRSIKLMQDLEGFRIRIGKLKGAFNLERRKTVYLTQEEVVGDSRLIPFDYHGSFAKFKKGILVYIDDGKIILKIKGKDKKRLKTEVVIGGVLKERKGINIPGIDLNFNPITSKDKHDLEFAVEHKVDYVAQSFVRRAGDITALRRVLKPQLPGCKIFAKIESRESLANIDRIIEESDGIIVARGDLGICVPIHHVPILQKEIIKKCLRLKKPAVVATQMLESMVQEIIPTRAEVTDVANAILDKADCLLLSAETAVGKHPDMVIDMMNTIIKATEKYQKTGKSELL
ncbi:MAG: pyruvate kinase [Candidatus Omnitrophota bacterium]